ncbi:hypothetical protein DFH07DRAFT_951268 [Mycena maculata]|uniref:Uncharacterized protein n=1 Tax=Mycena maculata TaxID=230809 RepID=A0AAD7K3M7_9AGAR|nr:hypothetical protein DFH07DRAFT_951268 [Mycena maculata]
MRRTRDKENSPSTSSGHPRRLGSRLRQPSERAQKTCDAKFEKEKALREKRAKQDQHRALQKRQNETALTVEHPDDTAQIRELRAALLALRLSATQQRQLQVDLLKISDIREHLDLSGADNDEAWADLRADVRRFMDAGMLDLNLGWKEQDNRKLGKVYRAIDEAHPELEHFRGQWVTQYLVHESFGAQKTYKACKARPGTYHPEIIPRSSYKGSGPLAPAHDPSSSPTPPPTNPDNIACSHSKLIPQTLFLANATTNRPEAYSPGRISPSPISRGFVT